MSPNIQNSKTADFDFKLSTKPGFIFRFFSGLVFILQHFFKNNSSLEKFRLSLVNKESRKKQNSALNSAPELEVKRIKNLSEDDFITYYLNKSVPVIFDAEAADWPCTEKWNLSFLKNELKDLNFTIFETPGLVDQGSNSNTVVPTQDYQVTEQIKAADLARDIESKKGKYLRFSTVMDEQKHLLNDLDLNWFKKMRRCFFGVCYQNFIGAAGRKTPLHCESTALFYVMADGEKRWDLLPAAYSAFLNPSKSAKAYFFSEADLQKKTDPKFPGLDTVPHYVAHLKKGDILFVPSWMWHQVENTTHSWGLSYSFTNLRGFIKHPVLVFVRVFLARPSFLANLMRGFSGRGEQKEKPYAFAKIVKD